MARNKKTEARATDVAPRRSSRHKKEPEAKADAEAQKAEPKKTYTDAEKTKTKTDAKKTKTDAKKPTKVVDGPKIPLAKPELREKSALAATSTTTRSGKHSTKVEPKPEKTALPKKRKKTTKEDLDSEEKDAELEDDNIGRTLVTFQSLTNDIHGLMNQTQKLARNWPGFMAQSINEDAPNKDRETRDQFNKDFDDMYKTGQKRKATLTAGDVEVTEKEPKRVKRANESKKPKTMGGEVEETEGVPGPVDDDEEEEEDASKKATPGKTPETEKTMAEEVSEPLVTEDVSAVDEDGAAAEKKEVPGATAGMTKTAAAAGRGVSEFEVDDDEAAAATKDVETNGKDEGEVDEDEGLIV
ncbi:hypothetical protein BDV96DRAFT_593752 [Lophiotrema nucula]|uniref:Uncharacterized protein n=1 Tax=Lophiotrema nucula TaxID=690887 RepID=A0A6A5ZSC4_9PLEO|nr:hypothetical protein BDV96DRAFT_593752 [Lophiotrema nucula]